MILKRYKHLILFTVISLVYAFYHLSYYQDFYQTYKLNDQKKKELYFSEGAFYYSFYDKLINADSYTEGLKGLVHNDSYEAPNTINPHKRFNITIELIAGSAYTLAKSAGLEFDQTRFYNNFMFIINSLSLLLIFLIIYLLTKNIWSFALPLILYLTHQDESSRMIMNTALRENIGIVFVLSHILFFYYVIRSHSIYKKITETNSIKASINKFHILFILTTVAQLIFWQFTQFIIVIEIITILALFTFGHLKLHRLFDYFLLIITSWFITVVYLMGSAFVLNSLFFFISIFFLISSIILLNKNKTFNSVLPRFLYPVLTLAGAIVFHFIFNTILGQQNDSHIFNFISAQFKDSSDFHAKLYLCDEAFNKISSFQFENFLSSGFLYLFIISFTGLLHIYFKPFIKKSKSDSTPIQVYVYYLIILSIGFSIIAYSGKRFLILAIPASLIVISYFFYVVSNYFNKLFNFKNTYTVVIIVLSVFIYLNNKEVISNIFVGERPVADSSLTNLIEFINSNSSNNDTFAASMPLSSSIVLHTDRKIFIHPQYENSELRQRVKEIYRVYGNFDEKNIHEYATNNKIKYIITEGSYCYFESSTGCVMQQLINEGQKENKDQFCGKSFLGSKYFEVVFDNKRFKVLKVK